MLDRPVRKLIDPLLERPARLLAATGLTANAVTWIGFGFGIATGILIAQQHFSLGLIALLINRLCDGLDGTIARQTRPTDLGGFLDIILDMIFYAGIPLAFVIADERNAVAATLLIFSFVGTSGSFLAFAVISAKRGVTSDSDGRKSFFYSFGLMEGTETLGFLIAFCLVPGQFARLAFIFAGLCVATTLLRICQAIAQFSDASSSAKRARPEERASDRSAMS
ncbi:MAG: CDP-alcohol phosphatidyltransferase family protein [Planctomycetota bacterium]